MIKRVDKRDKYNEKYHVTKEKTESRSFECHMIVKKEYYPFLLDCVLEKSGYSRGYD